MPPSLTHYIIEINRAETTFSHVLAITVLVLFIFLGTTIVYEDYVKTLLAELAQICITIADVFLRAQRGTQTQRNSSSINKDTDEGEYVLRYLNFLTRAHSCV